MSKTAELFNECVAATPKDIKQRVEWSFEIADKIDLPEDKIIDAMKVNGRHVSVDAPFIDGEDNSLLDVFPNADAPSADQQLVDESLRDEISRALGSLNERERAIVECFFGRVETLLLISIVTD